MGSAQRNTGIPHFDSKWKVEEHVRAIGLRYTILRPVFFMENFLAPNTLSAIRSGTLPFGLLPEKPLQTIAVDDIGFFASLAFDEPKKYIDKELDIAGDELTGPQMAAQFMHILDREILYQQLSIDTIRKTISDEYAVMMDWFNAKGYEADITALRKIHPGLKSFAAWTAEHASILAFDHAHA